uniref:Putative steroid receptor rna activator 1 n=1 Tax=Culex tarsalis TaxID=7177 RepID=A0A1Q3F317_CULTA
MSGENYRSATKSHDPGWNDPPKLSYSPGTGTTPPTKLNLNKRVAFPLATSAATSTSQPPTTTGGSSSLPQFIPGATSGPPVGVPPMAGPPPPVAVGTPPKIGPSEKLQTELLEDKTKFPSDEEMKEMAERTFREFVGKLDQSMQAGVQRRLDLIQQSWKDLGEALIRKLYRFAKALSKGDSTQASSIHRAIIVDHGKLSVQWAPALRQLMLTMGPATQQEPAAEGITKPI